MTPQADISSYEAFIWLGQTAGAIIVYILLAIAVYTLIFAALTLFFAYLIKKNITPVIAKKAIAQSFWLAHGAMFGTVFATIFAYTGVTWLVPVGFVAACGVIALNIVVEQVTS